MAQLDKRFALIRDGVPWYAASISSRKTGLLTYRVSGGVTRDAYDQSEHLTELEVVARRVLLEGKRMRCAPERGPASSLYLRSDGIRGYKLDKAIATALGVPEAGTGDLVPR